MEPASRSSGSGPDVVDPEKGHEERIDKISDELSGNPAIIDEESLPKGYFRSPFFIGTMMGIGLGLMAGVAGFGFVAPILHIINADIGPVSSTPYANHLLQRRKEKKEREKANLID